MRVVAKTYGLVTDRCVPIVRRWYLSGSPVLRRWIRKALRLLRRIWAKVLPVLLTVAVSVLLAWGLLYVPLPKVLAAVLGSILGVIIARRLELGVILLMILAASIIYSTAVPKPVTLGGQGFHATELLILFMLLVTFVRCCVNRKFEFFKSPITLPLLLFCAAVPVSILVGYSLHRADPRTPFFFKHVYNTARPVFHYLLFFVVAFGIQTERQLKLILRLLVWIAAITAMMMVVQYFVGTGGGSVFVGGKYTPAMSQALSPEEEYIARSLPPGIGLILPFFLVTLTNAAYRGSRPGAVHIMATVALGIGVVFTFTRNYWIGTFGGVLIVWLLAARTVKRRLIVLALTSVTLAVVGSLALGKLAPGTAGQRFSHALGERFASIFRQETLATESIQNRVRENRYAFQQIKKHPILGIGVGSPLYFKQWTRPGMGTKAMYRVRSIHNSYLELWMVYGLLGVVSFVWLSVGFLARSFLLFWRTRGSSVYAPLALAFFAGYILVLLKGITGMTILHQTSDISTIALMWGIVEAIWRLHGQDQEKRKEGEVPSPAHELAVTA